MYFRFFRFLIPAVLLIGCRPPAIADPALSLNAPQPAKAEIPQIDGHGKVKSFPEAAEQPRNGSKIVVDLTAGGPPDAINPGAEKLARYVNIYAAAGKSPARARIAVVLHGDATALALGEEAYAAAFATDGNPNLPLLRKLRAAGVEFLVCGQALTQKGYQADEVTGEIEVAVSGLTALVNRQQDGWAYIPLFH